MVSWVGSIVGVIFVIFGVLMLFRIVINEDEETSYSTRLFEAAFCLLFAAVGVYLSWPIVLLVIDLFRGSHTAIDVINAREAGRRVDFAKEAVSYMRFNYILAILASLAAPFLAYSLRRENPHSISAWLVLLAVPLGLILAISSLSQALGSTLPESSLITRVAQAAENPSGFMTYAIWVEVTWLVLIYVRHATAIAIGPVAIFMTPIVYIPFYIGYYRGLHWAIQAGLWVVTVILGFIVYVIREYENDFERERRNQRATEVYKAQIEGTSQIPTSQFSLFLRPFTITGTLDIQGMGETEGMGEAVEPLDFETVLARAVMPQSLLLALSRPNEAEVVGASRLFLPDSGWWVHFKELAEKAKDIFLLPAYSPGSLREIDWLFKQGLLKKCIFIMPETPSGEGLQVTISVQSSFQYVNSTRVDHSHEWELAVRAFEKETDVRLPDYISEGALFSLNADGTLRKMQTLKLANTFRRIRKVRMAIQAVGSRT